MMPLGRVGLWTRQLDSQPAAAAIDAVAGIEALGYPTLWIPEAIEREVLSHATMLLGATSELVVATGIARVHARAPQATALAQLLLAERYPGRFLLGLGVSHQFVVERVLGQAYGKPLEVMRAYLDAMDVTLQAPHPAPPAVPPPRVLAALGPHMLELAGTRADGAHTYLAPVEHTAWARAALGPHPLLAPSVKVFLGADASVARDVARRSVGPALRSQAYRANIVRVGWSENDLAGPLSDRLVDALVAWGDVEAITASVRGHLDAGADHVCVEVLTGDDTTIPMAAWQELAPALLTL
jgi:probable F420-dependent oxidoreductase